MVREHADGVLVLSVERATRFEWAFNMKTANALGLAVSPAVLMRVDELMQ